MAVAFGRYELLKKIASGGMGQVFLARTATQGFQKLIVIKRILPHLVEDEEFLTMFFDEARIAARLNHPNLIQIFDLDEVEGMHYLAMEYVSGDDVRRVEKSARKSGRTIPPGVACRIISDAAAGLDYAHAVKDSNGNPLNLIHRDVSPQNILVGFDGGVKLIDFGVARAAGRAQHTATGILKGKYPYMSPEQIAGEEYDHTSDQFALGTVFWEILTGKRLFKGDSDMVTMRLVRECKVPAPSSLVPELPAALDAIVLKALAPKAKDRFRDCGEFRMALEDFIVQQHMAASSAHLSAFMRELYQARIERESDISNLDELSGPSAFEDDSWPSDSRVPRVVPPGEGGADPRPTAVARSSAGGTRPRTQALTRPGNGRRVPTAALIVAVVVLAAGVAAVPLFLQKPAPVPQAVAVPEPVGDPQVVQPTTVPQPPKDPPEAQVRAPQPVRIQLLSSPAGALVTVNGERVGPTPAEFALAPGTGQATAVFSMKGYESAQAVLTADAPEVSVSLRRKKKQSNPKDKGSDAQLQIKTGR